MKLVAFNKHEDGYAAVWKGKTEKAPATAVGRCPDVFALFLFMDDFHNEAREVRQSAFHHVVLSGANIYTLE